MVSNPHSNPKSGSWISAAPSTVPPVYSLAIVDGLITMVPDSQNEVKPLQLDPDCIHVVP